MEEVISKEYNLDDESFSSYNPHLFKNDIWSFQNKERQSSAWFIYESK